MEDESTGGGGGGGGGGDGGSNSTTTEGERLLGISLKLLQSRDLTGAREFALLSQENDPLLHGSDEILAIADVLLSSSSSSSDKPVDWYSILQSHPTSDLDSIKKNYRRLGLLLHPDHNKFPFADSAFKLVSDAWSVLSDPSKRSAFDPQFQPSASVFSAQDKDKLPVRRSARASTADSPNFWTACPYCYLLFEYPKVYEECCLRCQHCQRGFHATPLASLPPTVPGKEAYYCCWGFFPLGFSLSKGKPDDDRLVNDNANVDNVNSGFPNWMSGVGAGVGTETGTNINVSVGVSDGSASADVFNNNNNNKQNTDAVNVDTHAGGYTNTSQGMPVPGAKKRGRPRKNPVPAG